MIDFLYPECLKTGSTAKSKKEILREIAGLARKSPVLQQITEDAIFHALEEREQVSSTGLEAGIAIPHCCFEELDQFVVGLILHPRGLDFDSFDGKKTNLFFFIIGSAGDRNRHIKILSAISRLAKEKEVIKKLIHAKEEKEVYALLEEKAAPELEKEVTHKCQFTIHIQEEECFEDILEILTSQVEGDISIMEAQNAGFYLNKLPLFASFWNDTHKKFSRLIVAVVDKRLMNDTIRRINMIIDKAPEKILLTVQNLSYCGGSIEF